LEGGGEFEKVRSKGRSEKKKGCIPDLEGRVLTNRRQPIGRSKKKGEDKGPGYFGGEKGRKRNSVTLPQEKKEPRGGAMVGRYGGGGKHVVCGSLEGSVLKKNDW